MSRGVFNLWSALAAFAASLAAGAAHAAEDWITAGIGQAAVYETDLSKVQRTGDLVRSLIRIVPARPTRDEGTHRTYVVEYQERFDDCANHRFQFGSYSRRDGRNAEVAAGTGLATGWHEVAPGTIGEAISRTNCAIANPPPEPPIQPDLHEGSWTDLGAAADGKSRLHVKIDGVERISDRTIVAISRSDYDPPEWIDGFAIRHIITGVAVDCAKGASASLGADFYVAPSARVKSVRVPPKELVFAPEAPGSFLARSRTLLCAAAVKAGGKDEEAGGVSVGTAWAGDKGYLITASHVIAGGRRIEIYREGERVGTAAVVSDDPANDVAVLKYRPLKAGEPRVILPISTHPPALGRSIFTLGYPAPDALGQNLKMTAGQISGLSGYQGDARHIQIAVPIQPGNSGGPVIGPDGTVVGVVEAKLLRFGEDKAEAAPEMVNYALKAAYVRAMLDGLPDLGGYTPIKPGPGQEQTVKAASQAVFMVVVEPQE